ncbi:MAG: hypothetical protein ACI4JJ_04120 [Huintestinicola sp.]
MKDGNSADRRRKVAAAVSALIFAVSSILFACDVVRTKVMDREPLFCVKAVEYRDGISADYYGAGYKIWLDYDPFEDTSEYYISFWVLPKALHI